MTDPTLTLTATVPLVGEEPMVVEYEPCDKCDGSGWGQCNEYSCKPNGGTSGTRPVRYEVAAPIKTRPAFTDVLLGDFNQAVAFVVGNGDINAAMHDGWEGSIALQIMGLHRAGETLPGVTIKELEVSE